MPEVSLTYSHGAFHWTVDGNTRDFVYKRNLQVAMMTDGYYADFKHPQQFWGGSSYRVFAIGTFAQ